MIDTKKISNIKKSAWNILRSPKMVALLKLGAATVGLIHAIDELIEASKSGKTAVGFRIDKDD